MTPFRAALLGLSIGPACTPPEPTSPDGHGILSTGSSTVSLPRVTHQLSWLPDDGPLTEVALPGVYFGVVAGPSCAPSVAVTADNETPPAAAVLVLYFDGFPEVGMRAPLAAEDGGPFRYTDPLSVTISEPYSFEVFRGGYVEVVQFDAAGWAFRLEGEGFSRCVDGTCAPMSGGTVTLVPIDPTSTPMPEPWEGCDAGVPFVWPDGWDGCVQEAFAGRVECPETLPW